MSFRDRLLATLRAVTPVLEEPGVLVIGSEAPNLFQVDAASTLVVSQDVDIGVPIELHEAVKRRLTAVTGFTPSAEEPSVWVPREPALLEVNFIGMDRHALPGEAYVLEDDELPLLVFGALALIREGRQVEVDGIRIPLPRPAGLLLEKLVTDRTGDKGDRDLLVAVGLLMIAAEADLSEIEEQYAALAPEFRHAVRSNLTVLSLMKGVAGMPDPAPERRRVVRLLRRLEARTQDDG